MIDDYDTGYKWSIVLKGGSVIKQEPGIKVSDFDPKNIEKFSLNKNETSLNKNGFSLSLDIENDDKLVYFRRVIRSLYTCDLEKVIVYFGTGTKLYEIDLISDTHRVYTKNISMILKGSVGCYGEINITHQDLAQEQ